MFLSREKELSNDPIVLMNQYKDKKKNLTISSSWMLKDEKEAEKVI